MYQHNALRVEAVDVEEGQRVENADQSACDQHGKNRYLHVREIAPSQSRGLFHFELHIMRAHKVRLITWRRWHLPGVVLLKTY
jgi:hypothetical protein